MIRLASFRRAAFAAQLLILPFMSSFAHAAVKCDETLSSSIPERSVRADGGSDVMKRLMGDAGERRDSAVTRELLTGNLPAHLRHLTPVSIDGTLSDGQKVEVTICVTPDYLSVGSDTDYVRIPLGLPAAARIADRFGFFLPTPRMVDAIYAQAEVQLAPSPMKPTNEMTTTGYLLRHNSIVSKMRAVMTLLPYALTAGQKKDVVLTQRLASKRGKVAIYGWHRTNGRPIQPLSTVHGAQYADYSHGVRLISQTAFVNGKQRPLSQILRDPQLAALVSSEGPIDAARLQASLH